MAERDLAREVAQQHFEHDDPTRWFEELYTSASGDESLIPWAGAEGNPNLMEWLRRENPPAAGRTALVVGCGLGEDAEALAKFGFTVTAFDIAPTAIEWSKQRWPDSTVEYVCADLFNTPAEWHSAFDFVFECYTIQALPPERRAEVVRCISGLVSDDGQLLVVARARNEDEDPGQLPWPLTEREIRLFEKHGLSVVTLEDYLDRENPPKRRWRAVFRRTKER